MSPVPSSICLSSARIESMLISGPMLVDPTMSGVAMCVEARLLTSNTVIVRNLEDLATHRCRDWMASYSNLVLQSSES